MLQSLITNEKITESNSVSVPVDCVQISQIPEPLFEIHSL
jgi:hypothetical protein